MKFTHLVFPLLQLLKFCDKTKLQFSKTLVHSNTLLFGKCFAKGARNTLMIMFRSCKYWVSSRIKSFTMSSYVSESRRIGSSTNGRDTSVSSWENMSISTCNTGNMAGQTCSIAVTVVWSKILLLLIVVVNVYQNL